MQSKILRKQLNEAAAGFKHESTHVKEKGRVLYKAAQAILEALEAAESTIAEYKAPKLYEANNAYNEAQKPKTFLSKADRIRVFLQGDLDAPGFISFLKWNGLTLDDAQRIVQEDDAAKGVAEASENA